MPKKKTEVDEFRNRRLMVYLFDEPLTIPQAQEVLDTITMSDIEIMSKVPNPRELRGTCVVNHGMYVGQGTCIAKKFIRYGNKMTECSTCKSQEIVDQLNYIFEHNYGQIYRAEWIKKQRRKRAKKNGSQECVEDVD